MSLADDLEFLALAHELIDENGRAITVGKTERGSDPEKPWKGAGSAPDLNPSYAINGVFLPDMTLGLIGGSGFGRMDKIDELIATSEQVVLVAHPNGVALSDFTACNIVVDKGVRFRIHARKVMQHGATPIFYALGLIR